MKRHNSSTIEKVCALLCLLVVFWIREMRGDVPGDPHPGRRMREAPPPLDEKALATSITSGTETPYEPARGTLESAHTGSRWSLKQIQQVFAGSEKGHAYTFTESNHLVSDIGFGRDGSFYPVASFLVREKFPDISNVWMPHLFTSRAITYRTDSDNFQYPDVWQLPAELIRHRSGDCEDFAILVVDWLLEKGFDARVVTGYMDSVNANNGHAWAVVFNPEINDFVVIEATSKRFLKAYPLAKLQRDLIPQTMWNRESFWENTGFPDNFDYNSPLWRKDSAFHPIP